ncbi:serine kinase [Erythrobacter sp. 3-20A1M]|uniref:HPr kinase/phosphorylase n=1 Tax=Erythrobacter sp. 3-20A1M TaxID=2653850 RepID=UPI001BFCB092|nr:HPr kinase/phosphatase C-terminal domain-containing protein [Erythrobacter sp. 3-20A1M]QWC56397.1 serine kinase [Erythrobacter sp. 3-20A1M]
MTRFQASCVAVGGRGLLIAGPPGSGKSTLALKLIDRGATLVGDDGVELAREGTRLIAHPVAATVGLIEVRNVGIHTLPASPATVALLLRLTGEAPRYVEAADREELAGAAIPALAFDPGIPAAAIRAEIALRRYGLA